MNRSTNHRVPAAMALLLAGCSGMQTLEQTREDTKTVGLLVKSVSTSVESYQKQRDAIALASLRNRQALEGLAMQYEASSAASIAIWEVSGNPKRKALFTSVHAEVDALAATNELRAARKAAQEKELASTRSAVNGNTSKLAESSVALVKLGEARASRDEAKFFLKFAKDTRDEIVKETEAAASAAKGNATKATSEIGAK